MKSILIVAFCLSYTLALPVELKSRIKTQQVYQTPNIPSNRIYSIKVNRVDSSKAEEVSRCKPVPRTIQVARKQELFRLAKSEASSRQEKVYEKLTSLSEQQNIIQEFQITNNQLFVLTTEGYGYFVPIAQPENVKKVQTGLQSKESNETLGSFVLKEYKEKILIITPKKVVVCRLQKAECEQITGFSAVTNFRGAQVIEQSGRYFLFVITSVEIISYELTANGQLKGQITYNKESFGIHQISFRAIIKGEGNLIYVLDDMHGVWEMRAKDGSFLQPLLPNKKVIFQQFGCFQMVTENNAQSLVLACNPSSNNFFLMNLIRSNQFTTAVYEPIETVFLQENLYQISAADSILMGRVYSGVKLFWSSKQASSPYPYFYRKAGNIFLHNAIQSKLKVLNETKTIFLAAQDELLMFELKSVDPYVSCYSPIEVDQQYKITYQVQCEEINFLDKQTVCKKQQFLNYSTWEHKEVRVGSHILPFILSLAGVILIIYVIRRIHLQYTEQVEEAKRKYNVQDDEISL